MTTLYISCPAHPFASVLCNTVLAAPEVESKIDLPSYINPPETKLLANLQQIFLTFFFHRDCFRVLVIILVATRLCSSLMYFWTLQRNKWFSSSQPGLTWQTGHKQQLQEQRSLVFLFHPALHALPPVQPISLATRRQPRLFFIPENNAKWVVVCPEQEDEQFNEGMMMKTVLVGEANNCRRHCCRANQEWKRGRRGWGFWKGLFRLGLPFFSLLLWSVVLTAWLT